MGAFLEQYGIAIFVIIIIGIMVIVATPAGTTIRETIVGKVENTVDYFGTLF